MPSTLEAGIPGVDLTLTIDASLQLAVEREVYAAWVADRAKSVSAVVLDPYTGEILAQATYPSYDANDYAAIAKRTRAVPRPGRRRRSTSRAPSSRWSSRPPSSKSAL